MEENRSESKYNSIVEPVFESEIPPNLMAGLDETEREMALAFERMQQRQKWLSQRAIESNRNERDLDKRLSPLEQTYGRLLANWKLIVVVAPGIATLGYFLIKSGFKLFLENIGK